MNLEEFVPLQIDTFILGVVTAMQIDMDGKKLFFFGNKISDPDILNMGTMDQ